MKVKARFAIHILTIIEKTMRLIFFLLLTGMAFPISGCQSFPFGAEAPIEEGVPPQRNRLQPAVHLSAETFIGNARLGDTAAVQSFLVAGVDPNVKDDEGRTALIVAAAGGHTDVVRLLLDKGADTGVATGDGMTPLMNAASKRHLDVVQILLEHGADMNRKNESNVGALGLAARANSMEIVHLLMSRGVAFSLEDAGELLTLASLRGRHDIIEFFAGRGVSIDTLDGTGNNALIWAIGGGRLDAVQFLLKKGANPNIRNTAGMSVLMLAAARGSPDIVKTLIESGADVNARGRNGLSVLGLTGQLKKQNPEIIRILKEAGATE